MKNKGIKIALGSSSKRQKIILEKTELLPFFDAIIDGNNTTLPKPNAQVFLLGAQAVNVAPEQCIVFEDSIAGIESALAAQMKSVGIGDATVLNKATWGGTQFN